MRLDKGAGVYRTHYRYAYSNNNNEMMFGMDYRNPLKNEIYQGTTTADE